MDGIRQFESNNYPQRSRKWLGIAMVGNILIGAAEISLGMLSNSNAMVANALQTIDGTTYGLLAAATVHEKAVNPGRARRYRKIAGLAICAASFVVGVKAADDLITHQSSEVQPEAAALVVVSGGMNYVVSRKLQPYAQPGTAHRDGWRHATGDAISAVAATGAIIASGLGVQGVDAAVGLATSAFTIAVNFPTSSRLSPET